MRPGKLYIKIFLTFVMVLIITEILIFGLFIFSAGKAFHSRFEQNTGAKVKIVQELIEERVGLSPATHISEDKALIDLFPRVGELFGAKIWLKNPEGISLLKSFPGEIPASIERITEQEVRSFGDVKFYHSFRRHRDFYATIPIEIREGEIGSLHVLFEKTGSPPLEVKKRFVLGLVIIGVIIAILVIPVSRLITNRIKNLMQSVIRISEGDLSHRVKVKGKDEIGEVSRAFNRMADRLERMIKGGRELTANVSHELRTPLARMRVAEELLRNRWGRGEYKDLPRHLDDIREDIVELDNLIGRILEFSKLDIYESGLNIEQFNLQDLINELLERFKPMIGCRGLNLEKKISIGSSFFGDRDALRTAFSNILENATKFATESGSIIVNMHSEQDCLVIDITNSFEELAEEDLTRLFDPFFRTEQSRSQGFGLGLAITRKIVERHGGEIEAYNSSEGLTVRIRFPS